MKLFDCIKLGFGVYIGYELGKEFKSISSDIYKLLKDRIEKGYC